MKVLQPKFELMRFLLSLFWMCNAILLALLGRCLIENNILPSADNGLVSVQTGKYSSSWVDWSQLLFEIYLELRGRVLTVLCFLIHFLLENVH